MMCVRFWWNRFGPIFVSEIRKKHSANHQGWTQWRWHLDEVFVRINGETHFLWRAVDHEGEVLESYFTKLRNRRAALTLLKKAMRRYGRPKIVVPDRLRSYGATMRAIGNDDIQEIGRWLNNRAENSHLPIRRREHAMARFRSTKLLQKFVSVHASIYNHFNKDRHLESLDNFKLQRSAALDEWCQLSA